MNRRFAVMRFKPSNQVVWQINHPMRPAFGTFTAHVETFEFQAYVGPGKVADLTWPQSSKKPNGDIGHQFARLVIQGRSQQRLGFVQSQYYHCLIFQDWHVRFSNYVSSGIIPLNAPGEKAM